MNSRLALYVPFLFCLAALASLVVWLLPDAAPGETTTGLPEAAVAQTGERDRAKRSAATPRPRSATGIEARVGPAAVGNPPAFRGTPATAPRTAAETAQAAALAKLDAESGVVMIEPEEVRLARPGELDADGGTPDVILLREDEILEGELDLEASLRDPL